MHIFHFAGLAHCGTLASTPGERHGYRTKCWKKRAAPTTQCLQMKYANQCGADGAKCREVLQAAIWEKCLWVELLSGCHQNGNAVWILMRCVRLPSAVAAACACAWRGEFRRGVFSYPSPACGGGRRSAASAGGGRLPRDPTPPACGGSASAGTLPFHGGIRKRVSAIAPILCGAGCAVVLPRLCGDQSFPLDNARGWSTERRTSLSVLPRSCCQERGRLSALHDGDFCSAGPRFLGRGQRLSPSPAGSLRSGRNAARSGPGASRARGSEPRPRAPHLLPPARRLMRAPSRGGDEWNIIL